MRAIGWQGVWKTKRTTEFRNTASLCSVANQGKATNLPLGCSGKSHPKPLETIVDLPKNLTIVEQLCKNPKTLIVKQKSPSHFKIHDTQERILVVGEIQHLNQQPDKKIAEEFDCEESDEIIERKSVIGKIERPNLQPNVARCRLIRGTKRDEKQAIAPRCSKGRGWW